MHMDFITLLAFAIQVTAGVAKHYGSSSGESIENILYYKDCNHQNTERPMLMRAEVRPEPPRQPECIPRMCCSMTCANNCGGQDDKSVDRQPSPQSAMLMPPIQPQLQPPLAFNQRSSRKKKFVQKPIGGRRGMGFTREHIKNLISQDQDIKKIIKDLVRVTMQKVDLVDMMNARRNAKKNVVLDQEEPNDNIEASNEGDG